MGVLTKKNLLGEMDRISFLGFPMDRLTLDDTVQKAEEFIQSGKAHQIVVMNAAKVILARQDKALADIISSADIVGPDGMPLIWASRLFGQPLPGRVNGTDLMERLVEVAARRGYSVYFLGAQEEVVRKTVEIHKLRYPELRVAGWRNGYFSSEEESQIIQEIRDSKAQILLVGISTPFKEKWIAQHLNRLRVPVCHGVGGSFDVVAGFVERAPVWMQNWGLEWVYRLYQEPRRMWKRYLITNSKFICLVLLEAFKTRFRL